MERKRFSVLFFIKRSKLLKNGEAPVRVRVTYDRLYVELQLKRSIKVPLWSQEKEKSTGKDRNSVELNHYIDALRVKFYQIYQDLELEGKIISARAIVNRYQGKDETFKTFISNSPKDMLRYAVCLKEDDFIIGDVFALREYTDTFSVGWHFNQRFEGKGLAYEAATGLLDYLFHDSGARRIYGFVEDDNLRSKRLCERLGMRHEGCMKEFISFVCHPDGAPRYEDTCIYAILNKEWKSNRQR